MYKFKGMRENVFAYSTFRFRFLICGSNLRVLTGGRLIHGWLVQGPFAQKNVNFGNGAWVRTGPMQAHTGPYGRIWAQKGFV